MISILLYILSFLLIWQFAGYPSLMAIIALNSKPENKNYSFQPFVSIIVPAYNEEANIRERIKNLFDLDYPKDKYEIIIVESESTDNTYQIVKDVAEQNLNSKPVLKLIKEEERKGKASAINFGKKHAKGDIILVTDASIISDRNSIKEIVPHFKNPNVGAVGGKCKVSNPDHNAITSAELFYWDFESILYEGESVIDSACLFPGEINAWRKNLVDADIRMLSEDLDMAIQIRRKGYKIKFEPKSLIYEKSAAVIHDQIIQRKRTSIGTLQCILKHLDYFLKPHNFYNVLIFPSHKILTMFSPFILLMILSLYIISWNFEIIITNLVLNLVIFAGIFSLFIYLKSRLIKNEGLKSEFLIFSIPKIIYYVIFNEYIIMLAWKDFIFRRYSILWDIVKSTRGI